MWIFLAFALVPLVEIGLFIQVGGAIGLWPTLGLVLATAALGTALVRSQGARALSDLRLALHDLRDPTAPLAHGAMILFAGAMLLTPGFFTDSVGLALLVPAVRRALMRYLARRVQMASFTVGGAEIRPRQGAGVIDAEYYEVGPENAPEPPPSGWTRH
ncbi:MAG: FxsA family protein [Phaeovulum sp.]|uniref:FxsA family protein n=1 Tax=Phaeovulum sp. TaxID=2934796 RepID=UPI002731A51C|nr:FxsA family protein [Phaeovulum sp.]MDP2062162.1 FxsA family protein [Phaeovulum sp.]